MVYIYKPNLFKIRTYLWKVRFLRRCISGKSIIERKTGNFKRKDKRRNELDWDWMKVRSVTSAVEAVGAGPMEKKQSNKGGRFNGETYRASMGWAQIWPRPNGTWSRSRASVNGRRWSRSLASANARRSSRSRASASGRRWCPHRPTGTAMSTTTSTTTTTRTRRPAYSTHQVRTKNPPNSLG